MTERTFKLGKSTTITSNIDGFELLNGEALANAMLAAGLLTPEEHKAALDRRALRIANQEQSSNG